MKMDKKNVLHLTLRKEPFDDIRSGEKTAEYREYKSHWIKRLMNDDGSFKTYDLIFFKNGYQSAAPQMLVEFKGIKIINDSDWGKMFEIKLGKVVGEENIRG
ncbi:MAG TPA: ASCH domain-containing protein [Bacteroidales bacterium]|nr:ASCH domain-containing protein [Bacteroidales bacterium]